MSGLLSVVATPIGNLEDITLRALRTLREASLVLAEDTRRTRVLLTHHQVATPLRSLHAHSAPHVIEQCVTELVAGAHMALVTDAGTPIVSDPGSVLVQAAVARGVTVVGIPGPSAVTTALTVAAIACDGFRFFGFLPRTGSARRQALASIATSDVASVLFESPQRIGRTLQELQELAGGQRQAAVCRELTKLHEEVVRADLTTLAARFVDGARGEITLVVAGAEPQSDSALIDVDARAAELMATGLSVRDAAKRLADECGLPKRQAYARVQALRIASTDDDADAQAADDLDARDQDADELDA